MKIRTKPIFKRPNGTAGAPFRRTGVLAATAAVALLAAACGAADETAEAGDGAATETETATEAATETETAVQDGPRLDASLFSGEAQMISGETFDLGSLADKDVVLWFWAPW